MLESIVKYCQTSLSLSLIDKSYKWYSSNDEWTRGFLICEFLKLFYARDIWLKGTK